MEGRVQRHREVPEKLREAVRVFSMHPEALQVSKESYTTAVMTV